MKARLLLFLFGLLLINQGCTVYQKTPVSLINAYDKGQVKVESKSGEVYSFNNIKCKDSVYYGLTIKSIKKKNGLYEHVQYYSPMVENQVSAVYLKDSKKSKKRNILLATSPLMIAGAYIIAFIVLVITVGIV